MTVLVTMRDALAEPHLLGNAMQGDTWAGWRILLIAAMGEELTEEERETFRLLTGRDHEPGERVEELWAVIGRRGGKTRAAAVIAVYLSCLVDYSDKLAIGERAILPFIATTKRNARKAFNYAVGIIKAAPMLRKLITNETAETLSLSTLVDLEVQAADWRVNRGDTAVAAIGDEAAFWRSDDAANPDTEILEAIRPALATTDGPLIIISSPYAKRGEVYSTWRKHFGPAGDPLILVAQAASRTMNPSLRQKVVDRAMERDEARAKAEWLAQFRSDVEVFLSRELVEAAIMPGTVVLPFVRGPSYRAFVDPSGGTSDSMTLAISHQENERVILDCVVERRPPFSPEDVVEEFCRVIKAYGLSKVTGDRYGGEWPRERFRMHGVQYEIASANRSELYLALVPILSSGRASLLDHDRLINQLIQLERRTSRNGRDSVDHPQGGHDDIANAVAGAFFATAMPGPKLPSVTVGKPYGWR
ncbi:hypothetical protein SAMN06297251_10632 [Fulvimarina manganoxydans]|uniref:Phage terminase-like protein, large subunit, contains N-terminal HTH domain n=1 Tax=Fulvimarina manganoxydans TaxID=937218 RepID=A0A1W2BC09_9HYPH|nr:hypothetical protein [Fulvimarina manganoxydans]SMC70310.1 hypothetical protein SAMN06297251_10632 [Fulvimarina manganoxydans]